MHERFKLYKHLMNGFSYMLPFVVAGGLLIAFSSIEILGDSFPYLSEVGELVLTFTYPVLAGFIAFSIADRPAIAPGVTAGALALAAGSGFIGAIIGGFMAGYVVEILKWIFKKLPRSINSMKPILIYPFLGVFIVMFIMLGVNYLMTPISLWLENEIVNLNGFPLLVTAMILGALMAVDMGGPINKIAYMIGVISVVHDHRSIIMAAIMAAGMIPPLAIALSVTLFKKDYTEMEKRLGLNNWVSGISFITEGAIPFIKTYRNRIHIPLVLGSILAAMIVTLFETSVPAPHGGLFVLALMTHWWGFVVAILSGMILATLMMKVMKIIGDQTHETT